MHKSIGWLVAIVLVASSTATFADFTITDFSAPPVGFTYPVAPSGPANTAAVVGPVLQVTPGVLSNLGVAWVDDPQFVTDGFTTEFEFEFLTSPTGGGGGSADGLAFVIQNDSLAAIGNHASAIGYGGFLGSPDRGINNSIAIEFDDFANSNWNDVNGNHISVHTLFAADNSQDELTASIGANTAVPFFGQGSGTHLVRIEYFPGEMTIFLDDLTTPALVVAVDLAAVLGGTDAWVGFTGSGGGAYQVQNVYSWTFNLGPPEECTNGIDDDSDGLTDCDDPECASDPACPETCDDGVDNDADGLVDCDDSECAMAPNCFEADCVDGIDGDGDGLTDCEDLDCVADAACLEQGNCGDGIDNDLDGFTDCADDDCACDPTCLGVVANDECVDAIPVGPGDTTFSNVGATLSGPIDADFNMTTDVWFSYTNTSGTDEGVRVGTCNPTPGACVLDDTTLIVYDGATCPVSPAVGLANDDDSCGPTGFNSEVEVTLAAGDSLLIQAGGWNGTEGVGVLTITLFDPEICDDSIDNDLDGLVDCADPDCAAAANCTETGAECTDTIDNDLDGLVDCADPDCSTEPSCQENTDAACADGLDNDGDGLIDCADADCAAADPCTEVGECDDTIDNDGDGLVDCDDTDCLGDCACSTLVYAGETDLIVNYDGIDGDEGLVASAAELELALIANGFTVLVANASVLESNCVFAEANLERIWVMLGTFPSDNRMGEVGGNAVLEYQLLVDAHATGKSIYLESPDNWGFQHVDSAYDDIDGVENDQDGADDAPDGGDLVVSLDGFATGLGLDTTDLQDVTYTQDQAASDWTDELVVATTDAGVAGAGKVFGPDDALGIVGQLGGDFATVVYAQSISGGCVISASVEFGGVGDSLTREDLADRYASALSCSGDPADVFLRADTNNDGSVNVADAVYLANALFVPGSPPPECTDSGDANDDGAVNIADVVWIANYLFIPGSAPPPPPFPGCGEDPSADPLDCSGFTGTGC